MRLFGCVSCRRCREGRQVCCFSKASLACASSVGLNTSKYTENLSGYCTDHRSNVGANQFTCSLQGGGTESRPRSISRVAMLMGGYRQPSLTLVSSVALLLLCSCLVRRRSLGSTCSGHAGRISLQEPPNCSLLPYPGSPAGL